MFRFGVCELVVVGVFVPAGGLGALMEARPQTVVDSDDRRPRDQGECPAPLARHYDQDRRAVDRERSPEAELDRSASGLGAWLAADQSSPSRRAARNEDVLRLADALALLPEQMHEALGLQHCQGWTLRQVAGRIGKTVSAVASLLRRGLEQLRKRLAEEHHDDRPG